MRNGYFQVVKCGEGTGIKIFPGTDDGENIKIADILAYLDSYKITYNLNEIKMAVTKNVEATYPISEAECPVIRESYKLDISKNLMSASAFFYPPSETGSRLTFDEFINDLRYKNIFFGLQMQNIQDHFMSDGIYGTSIEIAKGREPVHGTDDRIEYTFNTDLHIQPTVREDGSVDFFNLNTINHCKKGEVLARIIPGVPGENGTNIMGQRIAPHETKHLVLKHGKNIDMAEDKLSVSSAVDGHVLLIDDEIFVSDVYEIENVDVSTGNIEYTGSVKINGNVNSNFKVSAGGNVIVNGVVEGAEINAGGDIIIARGVTGMAKGILRAGGNVVAKYIENATVEADGYVTTESILHSHVSAGVSIDVTGRRGFITGGHVQASSKITVKNLGAEMGAATIVEVGVDPKIKAKYNRLSKEVIDIVKTIRQSQPVLSSFAQKKASGARISPDQLKYVKEVAGNLEKLKVELEEKNAEVQQLQAYIDKQTGASIDVQGDVYPGTTVVIGELSLIIQDKYSYCRFQVVDGDVKAVAL